MKEEKVVVELDPYEEGAVITALNDMRNKELEKQEPTDFVDELLLKILHAPGRKVRVRDEAR
ncbi:hypothetical protein FACS18947_6870 [Bacteroidia bacterium]|nr:hypothetical protein FACS18947_6870 [Bacteroidia bacterium]